MKRGDVFKVGEGEQLYYADAIAPSGKVYALPYDPETGQGRKLTIFKPDMEFQVLFNNRKTPPPPPPKPEPLKLEDGWDYCEIIRKSELTDPVSSQTCWFAQTIGAEPPTILGKSEQIAWDIRDGTWTGEVSDEKSEQLRQDLINTLVDQAWQGIEEKGHGIVLKRKQPVQ
ncbi:MAG: hypothetical protein AAGD25_14810 [Cyanobacteria bacterium P01_F01_bin.150]